MKDHRTLSHKLMLPLYYLFDKIKDNLVDIRYKNIYLAKKKEGHTEIKANILGKEMIMPLHKTGIQKDLVIRGIREDNSTRFIQSFLNKGDVVLDIGANIGYYVMIESTLIGEHGKIHAVEPIEENITYLRKNIKLNGLKNIETYMMAIGNKKDDEAKIFLSDKCNCHSFIRDIHQSSNTTNVKMMTLDDFVKTNNIKKVDFIRMDVEGYEIFILEYAKETLEKFKPKLFIEIHSKHILKTNLSIKKMLYYLHSIGYEVAMACCAGRIEQISILDLAEDIRVADSTTKEKRTGRKATFRVFFKPK